MSVIKTGIEGLGIVKRGNSLWRYSNEGADVGPQMKTLGEAKAYAEQYAVGFGLMRQADSTLGLAVYRAIETLERCHNDKASLAYVAKELRAALNA